MVINYTGLERIRCVELGEGFESNIPQGIVPWVYFGLTEDNSLYLSDEEAEWLILTIF